MSVIDVYEDIRSNCVKELNSYTSDLEGLKVSINDVELELVRLKKELKENEDCISDRIEFLKRFEDIKVCLNKIILVIVRVWD